MIKYGERFDYVNAFLTKYKDPLHAERYLKRFLEDHGLTNAPSTIRFGRVRADGRLIETLAALK